MTSPGVMPYHYDRDELTRQGHVPSLVSTPEGPDGDCSCGWHYAGLAMAGTVTAIRHHIEDVDRKADVSPLPSDAIAAGDQAEAQVITRGRVNAHVLLSDVGLTMDHLSEDERGILDVGIRCGALAVLQFDLAESMEQMRRGEGTVLLPRPDDDTTVKTEERAE